ncbi:MAG: helicase, partial [Oscillospiraceae bacterium]|nr:helicase [Oscillospiraceae bacterium]
MAISLFAHNQTAYDAALAMLAETGKAAVIHPTGTGKSFIAFKYCEDHPDQRICWLSPSEYIYKTQWENYRRAGGEELGNIQFFTYARLMMMSDEELAEIRPDFEIVDEYHRIGAQKWGQGFARLRELWPAVPLLGLSATSIRYLDGQRDMAEELFDGNVASEMTLGEAIVRGILAPPKYVLSVFSYQNQLEKYEVRIRKQKSKATRDAAQEVLEQLRRALDKAEGLDSIFARHMEKRGGKYLVFCANAEHMTEMLSHVPDWFSRVDPEPHVYQVYSEDPTAARDFEDFRADDS